MDPLALLTRSAKRPKSHSQNAPKIPSRGPTGNPQLYPSSVSSPALKRKRDSDDDFDSTSDGETGLDFFSGDAAREKKQKIHPTKTADHGTTTFDLNAPTSRTPRMSLEDRRRLFKQHKLKCSILEPSESDGLVDKKKLEKSKRKSLEKVKPKAAKGASQIFPEPIEHFHQLRSRFKISDTLAKNIHEQGFKLPTEVQMASLPLLLGGAAELENEDDSIGTSASEARLNLLTVAPTGSGKTLAFLIPLLHSIHGSFGKKAHTGPLAVVLAPTKELVHQIVNEGRKLAVDLDIDIVAARKGINTGSIESEVAIPHIVVGTPLGFLHALEQKTGDEEDKESKDIAALPSVQHLVLDEADVLLDPLFKTQTLDVWKALSNKSLTISLWSATMSSTIETEVQKILAERHDGHVYKQPFLARLIVGLKDSAVPNISHKLTYCATETGKLMALRELLSPKSAASSPTDVPLRAPFLVFTQTIPRASALHSELKFDIPISAGGSSRIAVLHSELPDRVRDKILTNFRKGEIWVLITTDLLARGVDFKGVNGVVNYDIPTSAASYVHRVGRTGRAGREGGVAVTLFTKEDIKWVKIVANIIAATTKNGGKDAMPGGAERWLLDALPDVSKQDRKKLKTRGVQGRRRDEKTSRISTRSGYVRREENKRRGPQKGSH